MVRYILEHSPVDGWVLARDVWFAGALSGTRTWLDIAYGGALHGAISTLMLAVEASAVSGRSRGDGLTMINAFAHGVWEGMDGFAHILLTGDLSKLPDANERLMQMLETEEDFYGGLELEKYAMAGKNKAGRKYAGVLKFVRRIVLGLDYIGATGGRKAMLVYGASTRSAAKNQAIASETNPARKKELIAEGKKLDSQCIGRGHRCHLRQPDTPREAAYQGTGTRDSREGHCRRRRHHPLSVRAWASVRTERRACWAWRYVP